MMTYILALPYRHPLLLAKQIATMEFIAGGRFTLGTAVGHLEREFAALNVPFEKRGRLTDEYLRVLKQAWTADRPSFSGEFVEFRDLVIEPRPVQKPHPPIFIGGNSKSAMRRAVQLGDGWINPGGLRIEGTTLYAATMEGLRSSDTTATTWATSETFTARDTTATARVGARLFIASRRGIVSPPRR